MEQAFGIGADRGRGAFGVKPFAPTAALLIFAAYTLTLWVARGSSLGEAALGGVMNTIPILVFGAAARRIIFKHLVGASPVRQFVGHAVLGAAFSLLAYWLLVVLLGLMNGVSATEFDVRPFISRAFAWQMLENVTIYGLLAALTHLHARPEPVPVILSDAAVNGEGSEGLSRYFIRAGDDILPVDVARIVSIAGADDYAEVSTLDGTHLVRMTLAELEKALDSRRFIRVHRSRIVNVERIARAEPAGGGRILLHMENGETVPASRSGSKLLRDRVL
jgi:two-component system LytT family response regulator